MKPSKSGSEAKDFQTLIKEHVGLTVAGVLLAGFLAGVSSITFLTDRFGAAAPPPHPAAVTCEAIERQVESLIADHKSRMADLQTRYLAAEQEASSFGHIEESHQWWVDSAERLRDQITKQNEAFSAQVQALRRLAASSSES